MDDSRATQPVQVDSLHPLDLHHCGRMLGTAPRLRYHAVQMWLSGSIYYVSGTRRSQPNSD